jgi:hypothetical protein
MVTLENRNKVGIAAFCVVPLLIIGIIWFTHRRHYYPIAGRVPLLTIITNIILTLVIFEDGFYLIWSDEPCMLHWSWLLCMVPTAVTAVVMRCFVLLMQFEVSKDICSIEERMRAARQMPLSAPISPSPAPLATTTTPAIAIAIATATATVTRLPPSSPTRALTTNLITAAPILSSSDIDNNGNKDVSPLGASPVTGVDMSPILSWKPNWYTTNRHIMQPRWLLQRLTIQLLVTLCISGVGIPLSTDATCRSATAIGQKIVFIPLLAIIAVEAIAMVILSYKLTKFDSDGFGMLTCIHHSIIAPVTSTCDSQSIAITHFLVTSYVCANIGIKREFRWMGIVLGGAVIACIILWITTHLVHAWAFILDIILITSITLWFICQICVPLYASYINERATAAQLATVQRINHLDRLLVMDTGFEAFLEFSRGEFASESPLFWLAFIHFLSLLHLSNQYSMCLLDGLLDDIGDVYIRIVHHQCH